MSLILSFLRPDFTWPRPMKPSICKTTPKVPSSPGKLRLRLWGLVHKALFYILGWYCVYFGIQFDANIIQLPFGVVLKWTDRTSLEEAVVMQIARATVMPVPRVLCCGEYANAPYNRAFSILMTRLPGSSLQNSTDNLLVEAEGPWLFELKKCVVAMREWSSPHSERICSAIDTSIQSTRVPDHIMGPFVDENELHDFLLSTASAHGFDTTAEYNKNLEQANEIRNYPHPITFTHGDLKAHNILVGDDGHLSGFLDWEPGGWYPEYCDFTTAMRYGVNTWWFQVASWIGGDQYRRELACEIALNSLTVDSYVGF